jgi:hypothetical protein
VTAWRAPSTRSAARIAIPALRSAFEGMHAQYEHSPPTSALSTSTTLNPPCAARSATFSAAVPAPITMRSNSVRTSPPDAAR